MHDYRKLLVWTESIEMAAEIYKITKSYPSEEKFGLISQMRRAAVSVSSNIAEGAGRNTKGENRQFVGIAIGSCVELQSQLYLSVKLDFLKSEDAKPLLNRSEHIKNMLKKLRRTLTK